MNFQLDSFQQEIQPLNPGQDSGLFYKDHPLVPSPINRTHAEQDLGLIIGNQIGGPHSQAYVQNLSTLMPS